MRLRGVRYRDDNVPLLDTPQDDTPTVSTLITEPVHCTARHVHHDFQSVVASSMCGLVGYVPEDTFLTTFNHMPRPIGHPTDIERKEDW